MTDTKHEKATLQLARPDMGDAEREAVRQVMESGRLVCGPRVKELEEAVSGRLGGRQAVAFSSGTAALWAMLRCMDVRPGDEVIVPALSFPATVEAVMFNGATPVVVDVETGTFNIDASEVSRMITSSTKLVMAVDQFGLPADYRALEDVLERHGHVKLVTDSACSLGSVTDGQPCGTFGEAAAFSFHPRKIVTTGEGGMVVTDHAGLAGQLRRLRSHGVDTSGQFVEPGLNLRMDEMAGAMGAVQVLRLDGFIEKRRSLADVYRRNLPASVKMQHEAPTVMHNYQTMAVVLHPGAGRDDRDRIIAGLKKRGIEATVASYCIPMLPAYASLERRAGDLTEAVSVHDRGLALPMHTAMFEEDVVRVCRAIEELT